MKIGMIVAIEREMNTLLRDCGTPREQLRVSGYDIYIYDIGPNTVYVVNGGIGELAAAAATQFMITKFEVEMIVNFGVCGGLVEHMRELRTVVVEKVVHYDINTAPIDPGFIRGRYAEYPDIYIPATPELVKRAIESEPSLSPVICASGDKFIDDTAEKKALHDEFDADICEMESAGILLTANRNGIPALLIKGVSDSVSGGADDFNRMVHESASACLRILIKIIS